MVKNGEMEEKRNWTLWKYINLQKSVHLYHKVNLGPLRWKISAVGN